MQGVASENSVIPARALDINEVLSEREARYGSFSGHAEISQKLKEAMYNAPKWPGLSDCHKEALEMIQHKVARILNGDPNYDDNWRDISGYATLAMQSFIKSGEE